MGERSSPGYNPNMRRVPEIMTERARTLRNNATDAERLLWLHLRRYTPRFTRQLVVGLHIVDFASRQAKLVVELDGGQHSERRIADEARTTALEPWLVKES